MSLKKNQYSSISLFSGAGGMDLGFTNAGFEILFANDFDKYACETYRKNIGPHIVCDDITNLLDQADNFKGVDCVFGGPPCQGFSVAGKMDLEDPRSQFVLEFLKWVGRIEPRVFVMENVPSLATLSKFKSFRDELHRMAHSFGYKTELVVLTASDFGVPQKRKRMFLVGAKAPTSLDILARIEKYKMVAPTSGDILRKIGPINETTNPSTCNAEVTIAARPVLRKSPFAGMLFNGLGRPIDPDAPSQTLPASMGGNKTPIIDEEHFFGKGKSWVRNYHKRLIEGEAPIAMRAAPKFLRRLSLTEASALHGYPESFEFSGPKTGVYRQIGNSVPPGLAYAVASCVAELIERVEAPLSTDKQYLLHV